jgi:hypothetical protein
VNDLQFLIRSVLQVIASLLPLLGLAAVAWVTLSISKLAHTFEEFHMDYRRVHKLDESGPPAAP